jgi:hypothetical protein
MSITFYASGSMLNKAFGVTQYVPPATWYLGLSTTHISTSGSNASEPVGNGYARVAVTNDKTQFTYAASGSLVNNNAVTWPESTASWGTQLDVGFWDAASGGNVWFYQPLTNPRTIDANTVVVFDPLAVVVTMVN